MQIEPTLHVCGVYGCTALPHDRMVAHVCSFDAAVPGALVVCMNPKCTADPHGQDIEHKCSTSIKKGKSA